MAALTLRQDAPGFERFDDAFDFQTGEGGLEIWILIKT
jgi:hypothetical protein